MINIGKKQILKLMAKEISQSVIDCNELYSYILQRFEIAFSLKENIKISNFGTFKVYKKRKRLARNPKTLEPAMISERYVIKFIPSNEWVTKVRRI